MDLDSGRDWYYYSDSASESSEERVISEWENKINADGSLFFVKNYPRKEYAPDDSKPTASSSSNAPEKSAGILGRFMRRRNSRRSFRKKEHKQTKIDINLYPETNVLPKNKNEEENVNSNTFVRIILDDVSAPRQASTECLFGLKTVNNNLNVTIIGFVPSKASLFESRINIGDKLCSINGTQVNSHNLDKILIGLENCKEVLLEFQHGKENFEDKEILSQNSQYEEKGYSYVNGSVIYAKYDGLSESGPADQGIMYCFPKKENMLTQIRGVFFTLFHLLSTVSSSAPRSTTIKFNENSINVLYVQEKTELLLISLPNSKYFLEESSQIVMSISRCLEFMFQSLSRCFTNKHNATFLDSFFYKLFSKTKDDETLWEFESLLPTPCSFYLPKEIYIQIDDALNELESNFLPSQENQRLFTAIGSCYFYKGFLICNHLSNKDLSDIAALMKQNDLLKLCKEGVKEFIYWREVYPLSCQRGVALPSIAPYSTPAGRWYLLIVGLDHCFLATLYETSRYNLRMQMNAGPNVAYVEESQATLRHIMKTEFPTFIMKQFNINSDYTDDLREQTKSASTDSSSSLSSHADVSIPNKLYLTEGQRSYTQSTFKGRQSIDNSRNFIISNKSLDSFADVDYVPEEEFLPVLGRRAERELALETNSQSRVSVSDISDDSDWLKDYKAGNKNDATDLNDINKNIHPEDFIASSRFSVEEENVLIHFINFEASEGVLISSLAKNDRTHKYLRLLETFRQHAHKIQKIFLNTILFKKMKTQETSEVLNKSLVAVNEYGTLFHYTDDQKKGTTEIYWVVGKLFFMPHPREVYVCYLDKYPQNMVEIAFQLALSSVR